VDPSAVMLRQARRRVEGAGLGERVDLWPGVAAALPLPDGQVDHVVAVNSAALWPDLAAGLREASRVLRPGGSVLVAWHGAGSPSRVQRRLARPDAWWAQVLTLMEGLFDGVRRHDLRYVTAGTGVKRG
jgi:ubiquinone/menaquinone biosynthesis C-methylase UbiE